MDLHTIIENKSMTQNLLSKTIGVSQPAISKWCTGKSEPSLYYMQKLADALEVDLQTIVACFVQDNKKTTKTKKE